MYAEVSVDEIGANGAHLLLVLVRLRPKQEVNGGLDLALPLTSSCTATNNIKSYLGDAIGIDPGLLGHTLLLDATGS